MHVVHTFNPDRSKEGTVEELDDSLAKTLFNTGRARPASDEEIELGHVAPTEPTAGQQPAPDTAAPTTSPGTLDTEPAAVVSQPPASPESTPSTATASTASSSSAKKANAPTPPSTSSSTPAK